MSTGPVIDLQQEAEKLSVADGMRKNFFVYVLWAFGVSNALVWILIVGMILTEHGLLAQKLVSPADRTITSNVVMTLIGATTVQLGVALIAITNFLFKTEGPKARQ